MFELLIYMFENYLSAQSKLDFNNMSLELEAAGFDNDEIKIAFDAANISTPYPHMRLLMPKDVDYPIATKPFATTTQVVSGKSSLAKDE